MELKKIIFNVVIVAIIVFALDFAFGRTLRYFYFKETSGFQFRTTYSIETAQADILVFGSSRASHHYVPEVFEDSLKMSFYNTGREGNGIFYQTAVLKSILKRYTPKVIILDYASSFGKSQIDYDRISSLLPYYRTHKEIRDIVKLKSPFERFKLASEIYPFNSQILSIAIGNLEANKKRVDVNKGYIALYNEWQAKIDSINIDKIYEVDTNKLNVLKEFITSSKQSGADIIVIFSPIFWKFNLNQEIDLCKDLCKKANVTFFDFSKDSFFLNNRKLFYDKQHLNNNGAKIFSTLLIEKIKSRNFHNLP